MIWIMFKKTVKS